MVTRGLGALVKVHELGRTGKILDLVERVIAELAGADRATDGAIEVRGGVQVPEETRRQGRREASRGGGVGGRGRRRTCLYVRVCAGL